MDGTEGATAPETTAAAPAPAKPKKPKKKPVKKAPKPKGKKAVKPKAKKSAKVTARPVARPERVDMRVTKKEKAALVAKAKRLKRTVTSILLEAVAKIAK